MFSLINNYLYFILLILYLYVLKTKKSIKHNLEMLRRCAVAFSVQNRL